ncbi:MAG TPA: molybdate ABC transporter substrate-binding protein [Pirellulaceae bacterium]|nr:molybdate ABC transporter substrate-binding protein [Pirellulaceae bacterium]
MSRLPSAARLAITNLILFAIVGCSSSNPPANQSANPAQATGGKKVVTISVAASTSDAMTELARQFEKQAGCEVRVNSGPSNALANQIIAGAPADLFLSANRKLASEVEKAGQSKNAVPLLTNKLVLIVPKGNPAHVNEPADLLKAEVKRVALAGENVPAGMYAQQALTKLKVYDELVQANKIARGQDVRSTLAYVERGEAEAGIVYSTDLLAAKNVEAVDEFDPHTHEEIAYVLVLLKHDDENGAAKEFYDFLASKNAEVIWQKYGFERIAEKSP